MDSGGSQQSVVESSSGQQHVLKSGSSQQESGIVQQLVVQNIIGHQRKGKKQAIYKTIHTFKNRHAFLNWWKQSGQVYNWSANSRHPHSKGMVEYYYCKKRKNDKCPALLRVIVEALTGVVSVAKADERPHNHEVDMSKMERLIMDMEPFPMDTARVLIITTTPQKQQSSKPMTNAA
uniref:FLYWCH-type domain-containing protein n=1 Tax=Meloidogyne hapla TaxID=6305 RepID=A0A1I8BZ50_MELHA